MTSAYYTQHFVLLSSILFPLSVVHCSPCSFPSFSSSEFSFSVNCYSSMDYGSSSGGGMVSSEDANPPRLFINWTVVQQMLQNNTDGALVQHTLLLKLDGSLLTSSHETTETKAAAA